MSGASKAIPRFIVDLFPCSSCCNCVRLRRTVWLCRLDSQERLPILKTPGVIQIVGIGRTPIPVDEEEIIALQAAVRTGLPKHPCPFLRVGDRVRIEGGPLCGVEGILLNFKGRYRLVLPVSLLQRSVAVGVESAWVASIPRQAGRDTPVVCSVAAPG